MSALSRREQLIQLLLRKHDIDLKEVRQQLVQADQTWTQAKAATEAAQTVLDRSVAGQLTRMVQGTVIDVSMQRCVGLDLGETWRRVAECQKTEARHRREVEALQKNVATRQAQIRRVEEAAERETQANALKCALATANDQDALWIGARSLAEVSS